MGLVDEYALWKARKAPQNNRAKQTREDGLVAEYKRWQIQKKLGFQPSKAAVDEISKQYQSVWQYDPNDREDVTRKQQGLMPKRFAKQYNLNDTVDKYLYENNLPYASAFSSVYKGYQENRKLNDQYKSLWNDVQAELGKRLREDYTVSDADAQIAIVNLLHGGKYDALREYYKPTGYKGEGFSFGYKDFQEPYNQAVGQWKAEEEKKLTRTARAIDDLQARIDAKQNRVERALMILNLAGGNSPINREMQVAAQRFMDEYKADKKHLGELKVKQKQETDAQAVQRFSLSLNAPDFQEYADIGKSLNQEKPGTVRNKVEYARENYGKIVYETIRSPFAKEHEYLPYYFLTDQEASLYNYLLAKKGDGAANDFLSHMIETLNYRMGTQQAEHIESMNPGFDRFMATALHAAGAGLDQAGSGIKQLFTEEALPTSAWQYGAAQVRENLADDGAKLPEWLGGASWAQAGYDVLNTTAAMAPYIALGTLTGGLGASAGLANGISAAAMGLGAGGNAYNAALKLGYTQEQAWNYGALTAMSEGGLQYLLGGIGKLGGKVTGKTAQMVTRNINNAAFRVAADLGIKMFGEGVEEYFQEILDPVFRNLALGENNEIKLISEEGAYSFLLGAITAGLLEGPGSIKSTVNAAQLGNAIIKGGKVDALVANALTLEVNTEAYQLARQMESGKQRQNSANIGELLAAYSDADGDISFLTVLPSEKGTTAAARERMQAWFQKQFEAAKDRAEFKRNIKAANLDPQTAQTALQTYNGLTQGNPGSESMVSQLQTSLRQAGNQKAQMNAELNVAKTEATVRLQTLRAAMHTAMQAGDFAAFLQMKDRYQQGYALEKAKHLAARADMQSRAAALDTGIKSALAAMQERFGPAEGGELEGTGAQGYVNTVGEGAESEAQGQVAASTDGGNGGILDIEEGGNQQGATEGAGKVDNFISSHVPKQFQAQVKKAFGPDIKVTTLERDITVYRYYGGTSAPSSYWVTPTKVSNPTSELALPPGNTAQYVDSIVLKKGTTVLEGMVAPNFGQPGGGYQYYVPSMK